MPKFIGKLIIVIIGSAFTGLFASAAAAEKQLLPPSDALAAGTALAIAMIVSFVIREAVVSRRGGAVQA